MVDDSEMNRSILADMLSDEYEVLEAEDGAQAVKILRERHGELSLVLLDIVMPVLNGFGVLEAMDREHWIEDVPVVMISAEAVPGHVVRAYGMGVVDFVSRPFDALVVRRRIANAVMLYARREELGVPARFYGDARYSEPPASDRSIRLLELEREKRDHFAALTDEIQFEYTAMPSAAVLSPYGARRLGLPETVPDPLRDPGALGAIGPEDLRYLSEAIRSTSPGHPQVGYDCVLEVGGEKRWFHIVARSLWTFDDPPRYAGAIGKAVDIHESRTRMDELELRASTDTLTGLLNHAAAKRRVRARIDERPEGRFALAVLDLDLFKQANDTYGHLFGDELLKHLADRLRSCVRGGDLAARVGGDEFLLFLEYAGPEELEPAIARIHSSLCGRFRDFDVSLSMGVASTEALGRDYDVLFRAADQALYSIKKGRRGKGGTYRFYDASMTRADSAVSPIDGEGPGR